ncbi:MAG: glutamate 5-kinase [Rhodospirillaceae bacterium]|nr:glutamate 5-kinase [Rhodospirillaceae bacterium]
MATIEHPRVKDAKRVVIKIGSTLLVDQVTGDLHMQWLRSLGDEIADMRSHGKDVVIVTSGAVAIGRTILNLKNRSLKLEEKQAAAAAGQLRLIESYQTALETHGLTVAQILLTAEDTEDRRRYINARVTLDTLLRLGSVPVINENDTVATQEIRFGDNDQLASRVSAMIGADICILLSDVDGLYTDDPAIKVDAEHIPFIYEMSEKIRAMGGAANQSHTYSTGGMATKLIAAETCMNAGCHMIIAYGKSHSPISTLEKGARCSWFISKAEPVAARKNWISGTLNPNGTIVIDIGAEKALHNGKSLLPAGITNVTGIFERGDAVVIINSDGRAIGKGLSALKASDIKQVMGKRSSTMEGVLGYTGRAEIIHRDDLVLNS